MIRRNKKPDISVFENLKKIDELFGMEKLGRYILIHFFMLLIKKEVVFKVEVDFVFKITNFKLC